MLQGHWKKLERKMSLTPITQNESQQHPKQHSQILWLKYLKLLECRLFFFFLVNNYFTNGFNTYITNLNKYIHTERLAIKSSEKGFLANSLFFRFPLCKYMLFSSIHFWNSTLKRSCHLLCLNQEPLECQENVTAVASSELDIMDEVR